MSTVLRSLSIWSKLKRWNISLSRYSMSWSHIQNIIILKRCLLILCNSNGPFLNTIVTCDEKVDFIRQPVATNSVVGPIRTKALPKATLASKKKKGHRHCLMVCCQSDSLQNSESRQNHYIWEVCSANQWDAPKVATPAAGIGQQKGPNSSRHCPQTAQPNINILLPFIFHSTRSRSELVLFSMAPGTEL